MSAARHRIPMLDRGAPATDIQPVMAAEAVRTHDRSRPRTAGIAVLAEARHRSNTRSYEVTVTGENLWIIQMSEPPLVRFVAPLVEVVLAILMLVESQQPQWKDRLQTTK
jgi:hypothetical protein